MMMMGIHFMGKPPFKRVLLHGLVVDETGEKMSKVKGNVIDPLDLIHGATFEDVVQKALPGAPVDEALKKFKKAYPSAASLGSGFPAYGADALRFTLASYSPQSRRIPLSPKKIEGYRHFCNKLWNATRFSLPQLEGAVVGDAAPPAKLLASRWLLSRLRATAIAVKSGIDDFRLDESTSALYRFVWNELCDWFIELSKPVFAGTDEAAKKETRDVLAYALEASLRMLHPFIPYITEELWQRVPRPASPAAALALAAFPTDAVAPEDAAAERDMASLMAAVTAARTIRSEHEVHPGAAIELTLRVDDAALRTLLEREAVSIQTLVKTKGAPTLVSRASARPKGAVMHATPDVDVLVSLIGLVDAAKEAARVEREIKKVEKDVAALEKKLSLPSFAEKAPREVVEESKALLEELRRQRVALEEARGIAGELGSDDDKSK
jgi:valyl-tRNA synthetase